MKGLAAIAAAFLLGAAAAEAQPTDSLRLAPGDAAVVHIGAGAVSADVQPGGARWTPLDIAAARHLSGQAPIDEPATAPTPMPGDQMPTPPPISPGEIRLRLHDVAGRHTLLIIENGYDRALIYHARMMTADRIATTDVCLVLPSNRSFEHWPEAISRLELDQFVQVDWREGDPVPCR